MVSTVGNPSDTPSTPINIYEDSSTAGVVVASALELIDADSA